MKKYIALTASIIFVIPFIIGAMDAINCGSKFEDTLLGNLLKD